MKRILLSFICIIFLFGCGQTDAAMNQALSLRDKLLHETVSLEARITADYGDVVYTFLLSCVSQPNGEMTFTVLAPESIKDIAGKIDEEGILTFDQVALGLPLLSDGQLSPVSAPWVVLRALRGGYIRSAGKEDGQILVDLQDSYGEDAVTVQLRLEEGLIPKQADLFWQERRILTVEVENFRIG